MSELFHKTPARAREVAFQDFEFIDEEAKSIAASKQVPLLPLKPTSAIVITGYIPQNAFRFSINLTCKGSAGNVALHFNPRLDRDYVVRNSKYRGRWEDEETCSLIGVNRFFKRNTYVHILIFCVTDVFQIAVNGEHFCAFAYRMPLEEVSGLEIKDDLEDVKVRQLNLFVYPDPKICKPAQLYKLSIQSPLVENLNVPLTVDIASEFLVGSRIFISGRLKLLPHSFYLNLQKGKQIYPHPEVALHLNPRFMYNHSSPFVVMNCWTNGQWGHEERHQGQLYWMPGRDFLLTIRCEETGFTIWLGNKMICEFQHRLLPTIVDVLRISGDVVIYQITMSYSGRTG